jgi:DNA-binding HxlR family transcriptional regulator
LHIASNFASKEQPMAKPTAEDTNCVIAKTASQIGEVWTLLILRNAFHGMRRFEHFEQSLGIATNILSDRLKKLCQAGILVRAKLPEDGRVYEYRLSEKGLDLYPIIVSLLHWGERWHGDETGSRLELTEKTTGLPITQMAVRNQDGQALRPQDVVPRPGPKADQSIRNLINHRRTQQS